MASNRWKNYPKHEVKSAIQYEQEKKIHFCNGLRDINEERFAEGEVNIRIFEDFNSCKWNMMIGLEFVQMDFCPFCGRKLC